MTGSDTWTDGNALAGPLQEVFRVETDGSLGDRPVDELLRTLADPAGHKGVSQLVDALVTEALAAQQWARLISKRTGAPTPRIPPLAGDVIRVRVLHGRPSRRALSSFARLVRSPHRIGRTGLPWV